MASPPYTRMMPFSVEFWMLSLSRCPLRFVEHHFDARIALDSAMESLMRVLLRSRCPRHVHYAGRVGFWKSVLSCRVYGFYRCILCRTDFARRCVLVGRLNARKHLARLAILGQLIEDPFCDIRLFIRYAKCL
jgi:hypothetical protein